jgi:hypothetical protein
MQSQSVYCPAIAHEEDKKSVQQGYINPYSPTSVAAATEYSYSKSKPITQTLFTVSYKMHSAAYSYLEARD